MKIQYLSIVFIIIALPIILVTSVYNSMQINTIQMQKDYDDKLITASYDAIKAYQINTENNQYSTATQSKRRDVEAAIETFVTSLSTGLGIGGYGTSYLKPYIPAMLFTLYDGYYIYSPTENGDEIKHTLKPFISYSQRYVHGNIDVVISYTLDNYISVYGKIGTDYVNESGYLNYYLSNDEEVQEQTEQLSERLFVISETFPMVEAEEYDCWKDDNYMYIIRDKDGVYYVPNITYINNSFAQIENRRQYLNIVGNQKEYYYYDDTENWQRYYCDPDDAERRWFIYNQEAIVRISKDTQPTGEPYKVSFVLSNVNYGFDTSLAENKEYVEGYTQEYKYRYEGKQKIYLDEERKREFTYSNGQKRFIKSDVDIVESKDTSYSNYEKESKDFTKWAEDNLGTILISDAVNEEGEKNIEIFKSDNTPFLKLSEDNKPEETNALFNLHKREVIKLSIEKNLLSAINNYDKNSVALDTTYHFKMPVIQENEWDRILSNVSLVTFLQGLPVGFKTYNNYAIVTSSTNEEYVTDDTIYFLDETHSTYHLIGCEELDLTDNIVGYRNSDFERFKVTIKAQNGQPEQSIYYYRQDALPCYYCVVNRLAATKEHTGIRNIFDSSSKDYGWNNPENVNDTAAKRRQEFYKALRKRKI